MLELRFGDFFCFKYVKVYLEQIKITYICLGFKFFTPKFSKFITIIRSHLEQERKRKGEKGQEEKKG